MVYLWILFVLGIVAHLAKRAEYAMQNKVNPINTTKDFLKFYGLSIAIRTALNLSLFGLIVSHPAVITDAAGGSQLAVLLSKYALVKGLGFPLGYFCDSASDWILGKIPGLKKEIPWLPGDPENGGGNG